MSADELEATIYKDVAMLVNERHYHWLMEARSLGGTAVARAVAIGALHAAAMAVHAAQAGNAPGITKETVAREIQVSQRRLHRLMQPDEAPTSESDLQEECVAEAEDVLHNAAVEETLTRLVDALWPRPWGARPE